MNDTTGEETAAGQERHPRASTAAPVRPRCADAPSRARITLVVLVCAAWCICGGRPAAAAAPPTGVDCGNGRIDAPEQCDDGDGVGTPGNYCDARCMLVPCGKPTSAAPLPPEAADALFALRAALGLARCDLRVCDVDCSAHLTAADALLILRSATGQPVSLDCGDDAAGELADVHRIGRFDGEDRFAWPGSALVTKVAGKQASIRLEDGGANRFEVRIDGTLAAVLHTRPGEHTYTLATDLADGEHDVAVTRRTEALFGPSRFGGFPQTTLVASRGRGRLIEIVGDSITCGYGILSEVATCDFSADTEAETCAWGALAGAELGADVVAIAASGKGLLRNYDAADRETMPVLYARTLADDPIQRWHFHDRPDVVVVELGTNDFAEGDPGPAFVAALLAFVAEIRGHYGDVWILLAGSPILDGSAHEALADYLDQAAAAAREAGDRRIAALAIATQDPSDGYGCNYHPSRATARKMAATLAAAIRERLGW